MTLVSILSWTMCCFSPIQSATRWTRWFGSRAKVHVQNTKIFARMIAPSQQALVYEMQIQTPAPVAMFLPLPTDPSLGENALEFVALDGYSNLFTDLQYAFEAALSMEQAAPLRMQSRQTLAVVQVGSFEASFVPHPKDFDRLDPRFRMPDHIWSALGNYADWGFAVFQLSQGKHKVHPMAFRFHSRRADALFFPTVHVHDGQVHDTAEFSHALYYQAAAATAGDETSDVEVEHYVKLEKTQGLLAAGMAHCRRLHGVHPNRDTWIQTV